MSLLRICSIVIALCAAPLSGAHAEDYALILTNRSYDFAGSESEAIQFEPLAQAFRGAGFNVYGGEDWDVSRMTQEALRFRNALQAGSVDRVIIVLSGRVVTSASDTVLLGRSARDISDLDIGQNGVSVAVLNATLADYPGRALLVVAPAMRARITPGSRLRKGAPGLIPAQGVALIVGDSGLVLPSLRNQILQAEFPLGQVAQSAPNGLSYSGFLPLDLPLGGASDPADKGDSAYWSAARDIDLVASYRAYLNRFPNGLFADQARRQITSLENEPLRQAEADEQAMGLSRDTRRQVQRQLTLLGFDTAGIDGIFGRGSRAAVSRYQRARGFVETGFLSPSLVARLAGDAATREAEERAQQAQEEQQDRLYWQRSGASGRELDLRAYLDRYPNGVFADVARDSLRGFGGSDREIAAAWGRAQRENSLASYRDFVNLYPGSPFTAEADARIQRFEAENAQMSNQAGQDQAEELVVASNPVSRMLIERGLAKTGFDPGTVDGFFDDHSRAAIRAFQTDEGMVPTGFVSQAMMLRLTVRAVR